MSAPSLKSLCLRTAIGVCISFMAGRLTSIYYIGADHNQQQSPSTIITPDIPRPDPSQHANSGNSFLPPPELIQGKEAPKTKYTSMISSDVLSATSSSATLHLLVQDETAAAAAAEEDKEASPSNSNINDASSTSSSAFIGEEVCTQMADGSSKCSIDGFDQSDYDAVMSAGAANNANEHDDKDDEDHLPAGQHLIIDIERVNSDFLNSEVRLAKAMVDVINESKLTLLSYHCHKLVPMGVSCVGVLLESHISFHTWPEAGVITLDLFTCGSGKLVPVLPNIKKLFAVPRDDVAVSATASPNNTFHHIHELPHMVWSHKLRGFRQPHHEGYIMNDLMESILEATEFDLKEEIASVQSPFQLIEIFDVIERNYEHYEKSMQGGDTYEGRNPSLFRPNRIVFLDGVTQSTRVGNEAYHEALVHPAMFYHPDPKRVAIIGGGEGSTLREVLKHNTVENVKMIEIDELMVNVSREFLPDWNNCTDLVGSAAWCGDDDRADMHYVDAFAWFNDRYAEGVEATEDKFDVLIMDALDPEDDIPFAEMLYNNYDFVKTLYNSLTDDGLIVLQLGEAPAASHPAEQFSKGSRRKFLVELLQKVGFQTMHFYEDGNCGFGAPWFFLVAAKSAYNDARWYMSEAAIDIDIHKRILRTVSGSSALKYFDGGVKNGYQYPHKAAELSYCRAVPKPASCVDPGELVPNVPLSALEVKMSGIGDGSGRGVFTNVAIKAGSSIGRKENAHPVHAREISMQYIERYDISTLFNYLDGYGWEAHTFGGSEYFVEPSVMTFSNHGCNGSFNIIGQGMESVSSTITEQNVTPDDYHAGDEWHSHVYDIYEDRHVMHSALEVCLASKDIEAGEELFSDYLFLLSGKDEWWEYAKSLKRMCSGEEIGFITKEELKDKETVDGTGGNEA